MGKVVAKVFLINEDGLILVLTRGSTHPIFPLHFDFPGGEVETGEPWHETINREILEEIGLKIDVQPNNKINEFKYPNVTHALYLYQLPDKNIDINLSWEHSDYSWLSKDELVNLGLPDGVDPFYLDAIKSLKLIS